MREGDPRGTEEHPGGGQHSQEPPGQDAAQSRARSGYPYPEDEISLVELAAVFLRQRRIIAAFALALPILVVTVTLVLPRSWSATASFMPQSESQSAPSGLASLAGQFGVNIPLGESGQSPQFYADLVRSREILGAVSDTTFEVADTAGLFSRGVLGGSVADLLELAEDESPPRRRAEAIEWLREEAISVSTGTETGVVELSVTTPWPDLSAAIAEQIVDLVNEFNLETRQSQAAAERQFIEGRVEEAQRDLREAENALQTFLQNNRQFQNSPELTFEHDRLQRQVTMQQQVYTSLVQAREQARIDEVRNTPVITVVEPAEEPVRPDSRQLPLRAALGLVLGGMLGIFMGFGREYARRQREEDAEDFKEFSELWDETKSDVTGFLRRLRRS